jgi:hypothetical protein
MMNAIPETMRNLYPEFKDTIYTLKTLIGYRESMITSLRDDASSEIMRIQERLAEITKESQGYQRAESYAMYTANAIEIINESLSDVIENDGLLATAEDMKSHAQCFHEKNEMLNAEKANLLNLLAEMRKVNEDKV